MIVLLNKEILLNELSKLWMFFVGVELLGRVVDALGNPVDGRRTDYFR
jgi:flagellar biosynthesis/type III secretory pathway ATPase